MKHIQPIPTIQQQQMQLKPLLTVQQQKQMQTIQQENQKQIQPNNVLFVNGIGRKIEKKDLIEIFQQFSSFPINIKLIKNKNDLNKPKKAFITFKTIEEATNALNSCHSLSIKGKRISVKYSYQMEEKKDMKETQKKTQHKKRERKSNKWSVFVHNLNYTINNAKLKEIFKKYNPIKAVVFTTTKDGKQKPTGSGLIKFPSEEMQLLAIQEMNNTNVCNRTIKLVKPKESMKENDQKSNQSQISNAISLDELAIDNEEGNTYDTTSENYIENTTETETDDYEFDDYEEDDEDDETQDVTEIKPLNTIQPIQIKPLQIDEIEKIEPEIKLYPIPVKSYYFNETISFEHNGNNYQIELTPEKRPESKIIFENAGTPINGRKRDLIVELDIDIQTGNYSIDGDNIIQYLVFPKQYENVVSAINYELLSGEKRVDQVQLIHGIKYNLDKKGLKKVDGSNGDYYIVILLQ